MKSLLKNRHLLILGAADAVSATGTFITSFALQSMLIFRGGGSVAQVSGLYIAAMVPMLLFSPLSGWLCDRVDRKRVLITAQLLSGSIIFCLTYVTSLPLIYTLMVLRATSDSLTPPARQAALRDLVAPAELTQANAFMQQMASIVRIGAPMLAGALLAVVRPQRAMLLDVLSYLLAALALTTLPALPAIRKSAANQEGAATPSKRGVMDIFRARPLLFLLMTSIFMLTVVIIAFDVSASVMVRDLLAGGERLFGLLVGLIGLGMLLTGLLLMLSKKRDPWRDILTGQLLLLAIPLAVALAPWLSSQAMARALMAASCFLGGIGNGFAIIQGNTLIQLITPRELLGRMTGVVQSILMAGYLTGIFATPLLVPARVSLGTYFTIASIVLAAMALISMLALRLAPDKGAAPEQATG